jgi:anti-anti-sigma factor
MGIALEETGRENVLRLDGAIDIACAAELKAQLMQALAAGTEVRVRLEGATYLDVTAVQLLWAAGQQARRSGAGFGISSPPPAPVAAALAEAGFPPFPSLANAGSICGVHACQP